MNVVLSAVVTYATAVGAAALLEGLLVRGVALPSQFVEATLGALVGSLAGVVAGTVVALSKGAGRMRRRAIVLVAGAAGVWLAQHMGTIAALSGRARGFAAVLLVITVVGSMAFAVLITGQAQGSSCRRHVLRARPTLIKAAALFSSGVAASFIAHWLVPPYHRSVQDVIACAGAVVLGLALHSALAPVPFTRRVLVFTTIGFGCAILSSGLLLDQSKAYQRARLDEVVIARAGFKLLAFATDVDGDGYSSLFGVGDCSPWNSALHPRATEVPGNGVDDNCSWGDAPQRPTKLPGSVSTSAAPPQTSVALITIDTVRWDRVGLSGYKPSPTPRLDVWAHSAMVFERAYTASTRTCSSLAALHYGRFPRELRWAKGEDSGAVDRLRRRLPDAKLRPRWMCVIDEAGPSRQRSLGEWLKGRGMATAAAVNDNGSFLIEREFYGGGFDSYRDTTTGDDEEVVAIAMELLQTLRNGDQPFFLWVHLLGGHERGASQRFRDTSKEYDAALARTDSALSPLLSLLEEIAAIDPMSVVVVADHGELMGRNRRWHGSDLSEELLRVPLLVRAPTVPPGRSRILSSTVDVMPTILALTNTPTPDGLSGVDLTEADERLRRPALFSDVWVFPLDINLTAAYDGERKVVYSHESRTYTLFSQVSGLGELPGEDFALQQRIEAYLTETDSNPVH